MNLSVLASSLDWLPSILQYPFMIKAFVVGIIIAWVTSCIGMIIVLKRLSMVGDALSHASLAGVTIGLIAGFNPILGAMGFSVLAALGIEYLRKVFHRYSEISIAIIMSTGISLAGNLSGFVKKTANFNSFLFGSIVTIEPMEFYLIIAIGILVLLLSYLFQKELFFIAFDEESAILSGIPVKIINRLFVLLTALTIASAARVVGSLIISSMLVLPVATALQIGKSYKKTLYIAMALSTLYTILGLTLSFYLNLKPGSTIVLMSVIGLVLTLFIKHKSPQKQFKFPFLKTI